MWQAEADTELTLSASPATAVGQSKLYPGESRLEYGSLSKSCKLIFKRCFFKLCKFDFHYVVSMYVMAFFSD